MPGSRRIELPLANPGMSRKCVVGLFLAKNPCRVNALETRRQRGQTVPYRMEQTGGPIRPGCYRDYHWNICIRIAGSFKRYAVRFQKVAQLFRIDGRSSRVYQEYE